MTIGAILLAAGASKRMGQPKQLLTFRGQTLVRRAALAALGSLCRPVRLVVGCHADRVRDEVKDLPLQVVDNDRWATGMGSSIRVGLQSTLDTTPHVDAVVMMLCDQPQVTASAIGRLLSAYQQTRAPVVASAYRNTVGVPALFSRSVFSDLLALPAAEGARNVIAMHAERVVSISVPEGALDIDTPDDYERLQRCEENVSRRAFVGAAMVGGALLSGTTAEAQTASAPAPATFRLNINGQEHEVKVDTRTTLLDLLREQLHLTGTKKGCDHGQCGACTVLVNERRVNSCLTLAVACEGERVTTIEGLGDPEHLHSMQAAFLEHDGFQCGYCTSGQICSAVAVLEEARVGAASAVTADVRKLGPVELTDAEVRERMSGNVCRCGAYPNIVAAVRYAATHPERRTG